MKGLTSSLSVFSIIVLVLSSLGSFSPPREVKASTATSLFGYTWSASVETFQEISGIGTELTSFEGDDIWSSELTLGFFFPFFENSYSSVYISSNGFLFFGTSLPGSAATNSSIPSEIKPNNLIAPFWDDLVIGDNVNQGRVFCYLSGTEPTRIFIIEFKDVTRLGDNNFPFTFEVILHESGNIEIRYASMTGDLDKATIGIEDIDGIDGLELLYNSIGPLSELSSNKSYLFTFPEDIPRFKMSPLFQSNFLISGSVLFPVTIKNTGLHPDVFNLEWLLVDSFDDDGWAFEFLDENLIALNDSDGNSQVDTGTLQSGASKQILIKIIGPADPAQVGAFVLYDLVTTSKLSVDIGSSLSTSVQIQAANPAPFVQVFSTPYDPAYYEVFHPRQPVDYPGLHFIRAAMVEYDYYNSLTVISAGNQRYLSAWENNQYIFSSIHYSLGDIAVIGSPEIRTVQDNTQTGSGTNKVFDRLPSLAVAENGISAIAFVREITALDDSKNSNVMLALLDPAGSVAQILQLTDNTSFGFSQQVGIPFFNNPRVASTGTNFVISWDEQKATSDNGILLNIQVTSVTSSGMTLTDTCNFTESTSTMIFYGASVLGMQGSSTALLGFFSMENNQEISLWLDQIPFTGICSSIPTQISTIQGDALDMVQTDANQALVSYVDRSNSSISYIKVDITNIISNPIISVLPNPDGRKMSSVSMTKAPGGRVVLTWENDNTNRLYYALLDSAGTIITPPMIFHQIGVDERGLIAGASGGSLAFLDSPLVFTERMPFIQR